MNVSTLIAYLIALAIPVFAIYLIHALDLFKTSNTNTLIICVLWGAIGAFSIAYVINRGVLQQLMLSGASQMQSLELVVRLTAPILEEILKAGVLVYFIRKPSFRYFVDGAIYGFGVGIGFAVMENYFYISSSGGAALGLAISRVLSTSLMHAMASAIVGISLGRLRRSSARLLPLVGILLAISIHIIYNNVVNTLTGTTLLLVAITIGVSGAAFIGLQINRGLDAEKKRFSSTLTNKQDVSEGEVSAIQRLGGSSIEQELAELQKKFGDENITLIRRLLVTQANIGILQNNLTSGNVSERLRRAWQDEIAERQAEFQQIRRELDRAVAAELETLFPSDNEAMRNWLQEEMAQYDPTLVHTFDLFMKTFGLAQTFTAEQLVAMAESLSRISIFRNISLAHLENLGRSIKVATFSDGEMLFDQGDDGDAMYMVEAGGISIYSIDSRGREKFIRTFGAGSVVGDFAVLDGNPRSARARAAGKLTALVLQKHMFNRFIQSRPQVILAVLEVLSEKARFTTDAVEESIGSLSSLARGDFAVVAQLDQAQPAVPPAAPKVEASSADVSDSVYSSLPGAFARFARKMQGRAAVKSQIAG